MNKNKKNKTNKNNLSSGVELVSSFSHKYIKQLKESIQQNKLNLVTIKNACPVRTHENINDQNNLKMKIQESSVSNIKKINPRILSIISHDETSELIHKAKYKQSPVSNFNTEHLPNNSAFECFRQNQYPHSTIYEEDEDQALDGPMEERKGPSEDEKEISPVFIDNYVLLQDDCNEGPCIKSIMQQKSIKKTTEFNKTSYTLPMSSNQFEDALQKLFPPMPTRKNMSLKTNISKKKLKTGSTHNFATDRKPSFTRAKRMGSLQSVPKKQTTTNIPTRDLSTPRKLPSLQFIRPQRSPQGNVKRKSSLVRDCQYECNGSRWCRD